MEDQIIKMSDYKMPPKVTIIADKDYYTFYREKIEIYWIEKERCRNEKQFIDWLIHISEKSWYLSSIGYEFKKLFYKK